MVVPGIPHHVTQRGNRCEDIFFGDADRHHFLQLLERYSRRNGLGVLAYCLVSNHVHLVVVPEGAGSLAATLKPVNLLYARHVNERQGWCGRVWQERHFSCPMDAAHCLAATRYVEFNPVRAGMVSSADEYVWGSGAGHAGRRRDPLLSDRAGWLAGIDDRSAWLHAGEEGERITRLMLHTRTGRPLGNDGFTERLESELGRRLRSRRRGRPRSGGRPAEIG